MNVIKIFLLILLTINQNLELFGQDSSKNLLSQLEDELFTKNQDKILLYEYIGKAKYSSYKVDSTAYIRKYQPNPEKVLNILERIMHNKDATVIPRLQKIYNRHITMFWEEWAKVYMDNYYAPDVVLMQYTVLAGFENVLKSLTLIEQEYSNQDIFDIYCEGLLFGKKFFYNTDKRCELMKQYSDFSPLYRKLNPCRLFSGMLPFEYLDPFWEELRPLFIKTINQCNFENCNSSDIELPYLILTQEEDFFHSKLDEDVTYFYVKNYDSLRECNRHSMAFRYSAKHSDSMLSRVLAYKLVHNFTLDELSGSYPYIEVFTSNYRNNNTNILFDEILTLYDRDQVTASKLLKVVPIDTWKLYLREKNISLESLLDELSKQN